MRAPSSNVLLITFILGIFVFLSSMMALDKHVQQRSNEIRPEYQDNTNSKSMIGIVKSLIRRGEVISDSDSKIVTSKVLTRNSENGLPDTNNNLAAISGFSDKSTNIWSAYRKTKLLDESNTVTNINDNIKKVTEGHLRHPAAPDPVYSPRPTDPPQLMTCKKSFEPTCEMYNYVRFWNKQFTPNDCYKSPLAHSDSSPLEKRKFVVFQPDLGR